MYSKDYYKDLNRREIEESIRKEGFDPSVIHNNPGFIYIPHLHPETKVLAILDGTMKVVVTDKEYLLEKGDKIVIPGNTQHSATVGDKGCIFFWSEKII